MSQQDSRVEKLLSGLEQGMGDQRPQWLEELALAPDTGDGVIAQAWVRETAARYIASLGNDGESLLDDEPEPGDDAVVSADTSLLGQLDSGGDIDGIDNVHTLLALLLGGTLMQRRQACLALGDRISTGRSWSGDLMREVIDTLQRLRTVDIAYERAVVRERLPGAAGREARAERESWNRLVAKVEPRVREYWEGELFEEPIASLTGEDRAVLLMRTRDLPDTVAHHLCAILEDEPDGGDTGFRHSLLASLRYAGDPRLVPSLASLLNQGGELGAEAAQVLGRIDDPRVRSALRLAFDRTHLEVPKAVMAGALARRGDFRGVAYCRGLLGAGDSQIVVAALEALAAAGGKEDGEQVAALLKHDDPSVRSAAVKTLERVGDARVLAALNEVASETQLTSLRADVDDARVAIAARLELRGEELSDDTIILAPEERPLPASGDSEGLAVRVRMGTVWDYVVGQMWFALGRVARAIRRFERAAERRPGWLPPLVMIGVAHIKKQRYAQALRAFRRGLEADRARLERNPVAVRALAHTFLRRSEQMEQDGRSDVARGLIEELQSLDLRRARAEQRIQVRVRSEALRRRLRG